MPNEEPADMASPKPSRFMRMEDVADELAVSQAQVYALVRSGALPAIKIGGRGQWRIERSRLEQFITDAYTDTAHFVADNPFGRDTEFDAEEKPKAAEDDEPGPA